MFKSVWDRIHYGTDPFCLHGTGGPVRNWNGTVQYGITFISGPIWYQMEDPIQKVPCKHKAYPYQLRTSSKRIRSRVNAALMYKLHAGIVG